MDCHDDGTLNVSSVPLALTGLGSDRHLGPVAKPRCDRRTRMPTDGTLGAGRAPRLGAALAHPSTLQRPWARVRRRGNS